MKYSVAVFAVIFTVGLVTAPLFFTDSGFAWGDYDERERYEEHEEYREYGENGEYREHDLYRRDRQAESAYRELNRRSTGVAAIDNPLYKEECGSCHMAYPAGLLPAVSWEKIMAGLDNHFGDNAELDDETNRQLKSYLQENASDRAYYRRSRQFNDVDGLENARLRITESAYFRHEHDEIPARMVAENPQVNSFSHCNACHRQAEQGLFDEDDIRIPGFPGN